jgi:hypothetical protein
MLLKRSIASVLATSLLIGTLGFTVNADTLTVNYNSDTDENTATLQNIPVELEKTELYTVTLPKSVIMDGTGDTATFDYNVTVVGEISSVHYVRVIPLDGAKLQLDGGDLYKDLELTQTKRRWSAAEIGSTATTSGVMTVNELEPGKWTGNVQFRISLDDGGNWSAATCTSPAICTGYDSNDNGVLDADEILSVPITKGKALGHKFAENDDSFPIECDRCGKTVYAIRTPEQLTAFKDSVNSGTTYNGITVQLHNDIDMTGVTWDSGIGKYNQGLACKFDGNGYSIKNLKIERTNDTATKYDNDDFGIFAYVASNFTVVNLVLKNVQLTYIQPVTKNVARNIGVLIGNSSGSVTVRNCMLQNVKLTVNISESLGHAIGGLIGFAYKGTIVENVAIIGNIAVESTLNGQYGLSCVLGRMDSTNASEDLKVSNCYIDMPIASNTIAYVYSGAYTTYGVRLNAVNNIINSDTSNYTVASKYNTSESTIVHTLLTDAECKTQVAIDVLNTDNAGVWKLDLENINDGYPILS